MVELFFRVEGAKDGGYLATAVGQAIVARAATVAELHATVHAALNDHIWLHARPRRVRLHFIDDEMLAGWPIDLNPPV